MHAAQLVLMGLLTGACMRAKQLCGMRLHTTSLLSTTTSPPATVEQGCSMSQRKPLSR